MFLSQRLTNVQDSPHYMMIKEESIRPRPVSNGMRLLICTQAADQDDPALGFFHEWIAGLAKQFESVEVVCLKEGRHALPANVSVHSLGKSAQGRPASGWERFLFRMRYSFRFLHLIIHLRRAYDVVFVHQNEEYALLSGWLWRLLGKKVFMWRNHYAGSFSTAIAAAFCDTIFCTSVHSYTARYKKTVIMPIGVDTRLFSSANAARAPGSILFLGRMAPSKRPDVLVEALGLLAAQKVPFTATLCGPVLAKDEPYLAALKKRAEALALSDRLVFREGIPHAKTPALYISHEIFVNLSASGMYDKTLFEAAASGCLVVALSRDFTQNVDTRLVPEDESAQALAKTLKGILAMPAQERVVAGRSLEAHTHTNSLDALTLRLADEMAL